MLEEYINVNLLTFPQYILTVSVLNLLDGNNDLMISLFLFYKYKCQVDEIKKKKISQIISIISSYHKSLKNKYWIGELEGNHNSSAALRLDMADQRTYLNGFFRNTI